MQDDLATVQRVVVARPSSGESGGVAAQFRHQQLEPRLVAQGIEIRVVVHPVGVREVGQAFQAVHRLLVLTGARIKSESILKCVLGIRLLHKISTVVVGENCSFHGSDGYFRSCGLDLQIVDGDECVQLMNEFMQHHPIS